MRYLYLILFIFLSQLADSQTWHTMFTEHNIPATSVVGISSDINGNIWIASGSTGAYRYDGTAMMNITIADGLISNSLRAITCDSSGKVWMGSFIGLSCWNNGVVSNYNTSTGMQSQHVQALASAPGNILWIGTTIGLIRFDGFSFIQYTVSDGLPANSIRSLSFDGTYLWIGTLSGLSKFDGTSFQNFTTANGLPSDNIKALWSEAPGRVWVGTSNGAAYYNGTTFQVYTTTQGLLSDTISAIYGDASGIIWFGHEYSLSRYDGSAFTCFGGVFVSPSTVINCIHIANNDVCIGTDKECIKTRKWTVKNPIEAFLETSQIRAHITNRCGILAYDPTGWLSGADPLGIEFPIDSGKYTVFNSNLWLAGNDPMQNLLLAVTRYNEEIDFFPGPIQLSGVYDDTYDSINDRLWVVSKAEIDYHIANWDQPGYIIPDAIKAWPSLSAPYFDLNGNYVYEPALGDYPVIRGDKTILNVTNDIRLPHTSGGVPLNCEIAIMYWVYDTTDEALSQTIFVHLYVTNFNPYPLNNVYMGIQADFDIGNPIDDFTGCDVARNCYYTYNAQPYDTTYKSNIPAQGLVFLSSPLYSHLYYTNTNLGPMMDPQNPSDYYYNLRGYWKDGTPYTEGGNGYGGTNVTRYCFDGDPVSGSGWSEVSESNPPGDRRSLGSIGPFTLDPGKGKCIDFAYVLGRDSSGNNLLSVNKMKSNIEKIILLYNASSYNCDTIHVDIPTNVDIEVENANTCPGTLVELHPIISGLYWPMTYSWVPSAGLSDTSVVNPMAAVDTITTYYVTVTDAHGNTDSDSVTVVVSRPQLTLDSLYDLCSGERITLPQSSLYWWSTLNGTSQWYCFYTSGDYWAMIRDEYGCWSDTSFFTVNITPAPVPELGPTFTICVGETTTLSPGTGFVSYLWNNGSILDSLFVNSSLLIHGNYLYIVTVTDASGCTASDWVVVKILDCVSAETAGWTLPGVAYPNPFDDYIRIETGEGETGPYTMELYDALGRKITENTSDRPEISVSEVSQGFYTLKFKSGKISATYRLVKTE